MIHNVDAALRSLIADSLLAVESELGAVTVQFDAPTRDWASRQNQPTVDLYLYDIRRDISRNQVGVVERRDDDDRVLDRRPIAVWFRLAYLVTAWTQRPEDEHRILTHLMSAFLAHEGLTIVGDDGEGVVIPLGVAMPPPQDRSLSDVWSALGGELKPSLDIVVVGPVIPDRAQSVGPPVEREPVIVASRPDGTMLEERGGREVDSPVFEGTVRTRKFRFDPEARS